MLPASLVHLILCETFDQPLAVGVLPPNLAQLSFGVLFNQVLAVDVLPPNPGLPT